MGLGVRMYKTLEKLGTSLHKFPMNDPSPAPYTLVLLDLKGKSRIRSFHFCFGR